MNRPTEPATQRNPKGALTLLEILVVVVILSLLATMAVGVYTKEIVRARYAKARADIATLSLAINRYQMDLGVYPPSGSSSAGLAEGSGLLQYVLRSSISGDLNNPASPRWQGPYIEWDYRQFCDIHGADVTPATPVDQISFRDPFGQPYIFITARDYATRGGTELDSSSPFAATETYYNPSSFQIISTGVDQITPASPARGTGNDDVTNFQGSQL